MTSTTVSAVGLGLRTNWEQFTLLVIVNGFVGAMVGLERTVLPLIAEADFGLVAKSVTLSFLISFGLVKALANLFAGRLSDRLGRKRILIAGWLAGLPVPLLIIFAPSWGWIVFANALLGINQGLCWSTTIIMKIDLAGPRQRGLAMGLNEFAGYIAVALSALLTGYLATAYGLRPVPFYPGLVFAGLGLLLSLFFVRDTYAHAQHEAALAKGPATVTPAKEPHLSFAQILLLTSWRDRALFAVSQAGLVNNLNDGLVWGLIPIFLAAAGLPLAEIGLITAAYPGVWGDCAGAWDSPGLSDPAGGYFRCGSPRMARLGGRGLSLVAGWRLRHWRPAGGVVGRYFRLKLGDCRHCRGHRLVRFCGSGGDVRNVVVQTSQPGRSQVVSYDSKSSILVLKTPLIRGKMKIRTIQITIIAR